MDSSPTASASGQLTGTARDTQPAVQAALARVHAEAGLEAALRALFDWCNASGYLPGGIFETDELLDVPDPASGTPLLLQVNRSRARYRSPAAGFSRDQAAVDCPLCITNVGMPGKELLRVYEFGLGGRPFFIQHTPFPFYRGHYVLMDRLHSPMRMDEGSLGDLSAFLGLAPSFTACSNSDIMWAGASILAHHHYQVFPGWVMPVMRAPVDASTAFAAPGGVRAAMLHYPAGVMRVEGPPRAALAAAGRILMAWKATDPGKATANLVMRRGGDGADSLAVHLMFRHSGHRTREDLCAFKAEGVGVLEMAGMVIVPMPAGEHAEERHGWIRGHAAELACGIISSNSPAGTPETRRALGQAARGWV